MNLPDLGRRLVSGDWSRTTTPFYRIAVDGKTRSTYNGYLVYLVLVALVAIVSGFAIVPVSLLIFFVISLCLALFLDSGQDKIRLADLSIQLPAYAILVFHWLGEVVPLYVASFFLYLLVRPVFQALSLWDGASFVPVFLFYLLLRSGLLVRYLYLARFRWDDPPPRSPIGIQESNFRNRSAATRHLLWSFLLGNVGVSVRCASQTLQIWIFESIAAAGGLSVLDLAAAFDVPAATARPFALAAGGLGMVVVVLWQRRLYPYADYLYYRVHRTLHENRALFTFLHRVHHKAIVTSPLDSGTICPLEFLLTETIWPPAALLPDWLWALWQMHFAITGYLPSHRASVSGRVQDANAFHVYHHFRPNVNFGVFADSDARFGTLYGITWKPLKPEQIPSPLWRWLLSNRFYRREAARESSSL